MPPLVELVNSHTTVCTTRPRRHAQKAHTCLNGWHMQAQALGQGAFPSSPPGARRSTALEEAPQHLRAYEMMSWAPRPLPAPSRVSF